MARKPRVQDAVSLDDDPLWYKDAIIYEVPVRAFMDSNGDGIGDFPGLIEKPRLPARPRRHRPVAAAVLPVAAARRRLRHRRLHHRQPDLRQPGRFQALSRRGPPPRPARHHRTGRQPHLRPAPVVPARPPVAARQPRTRLLRLERHDRSTSRTPASSSRTSSRPTGPGTPSPSAYYWHRFYSHQPDLNYDNPLVQEAVLRTLDYWMDMGVDGFRLDAIPYLYEREGTNCENLPETHAFLKKLRRHVDEKYPQSSPSGGGQPVAGGRRRLLRRRRRRRVPHVLPFPGHAAAVHGHPDGGSASDRGHPPADAGHPGRSPVGPVPAQPRRADAGNGDGGRPRLHVPRLRPGPAGAHQPRHPPPPGAADAEQPRPRSS